ncbi:mitotic-spindle organizing protein 2B isoform X2 [Ochotona princeps]|uniref:mitotic-spindle organizing protein 2B isoform X2 n=1 Tax=Ochotona princeps TaxID=9978 RepID=UPI002714ACE4|nr:mitotic-spindle organizing protein 2B isoform X2 [Ochotona princeps]
MAASGSGPGSGATPGLEAATLQKLALRRKKVLSAEEMELYELAQAAGAAIDPDVFKILVDLLNLNVAPLAVYQMLKAMCAGQRLASEPQDPLPTSGMPETRGHLIKLDEEAGEARGSKVRAHGWSRPKSGSRGVPEGDSLKLSRGRNKGSATVLAERSSRDGSSQRLPRQPSASRLPKGAAPAKSPTRSNS